jgi:hypothetical protein
MNPRSRSRGGIASSLVRQGTRPIGSFVADVGTVSYDRDRERKLREQALSDSVEYNEEEEAMNQYDEYDDDDTISLASTIMDYEQSPVRRGGRPGRGRGRPSPSLPSISNQQRYDYYGNESYSSSGGAQRNNSRRNPYTEPPVEQFYQPPSSIRKTKGNLHSYSQSQTLESEYYYEHESDYTNSGNDRFYSDSYEYYDESRQETPNQNLAISRSQRAGKTNRTPPRPATPVKNQRGGTNNMQDNEQYYGTDTQGYDNGSYDANGDGYVYYGYEYESKSETTQKSKSSSKIPPRIPPKPNSKPLERNMQRYTNTNYSSTSKQKKPKDLYSSAEYGTSDYTESTDYGANYDEYASHNYGPSVQKSTSQNDLRKSYRQVSSRKQEEEQHDEDYYY